MINLTKDLRNINDAWVVVKKYNGNTYFWRGPNYQRSVEESKEAKIFYSKSEAKDAEIKLNINRKKCLYFIEPATKHFVNGWVIGASWYNTDINESFKIENPPIPIQEITSKRRSVILPNEFKTKVIAKITEDKKSKLEYAKTHLDEAVKKMREAEEQALLRDNSLNYITALNFEEELKPYSTGAEQTLRILFEVKK